MKKILAGLVAVTLVGSTALPTATSAEARWGYRGGWGYGGWGLGLGAVAAGAPIGGACSGGASAAQRHPRSARRYGAWLGVTCTIQFPHSEHLKVRNSKPSKGYGARRITCASPSHSLQPIGAINCRVSASKECPSITCHPPISASASAEHARPSSAPAPHSAVPASPGRWPSSA